MAETERPDEGEQDPAATPESEATGEDTPAEAATPPEAPAAPEPAAEAPPAEEPAAEAPPAEEPPAEAAPAEEPPAEEAPAEEPPAEEPAAEAPPAEEGAAEAPPAEEPPADEAPAPPPRERPAPTRGGDEAIPGADLVPDIVPEGIDPLGRALSEEALVEPAEVEVEEVDVPVVEGEEPAEPEERAIPQAAIDLAAGARYTATGKRKTAVARVILKPGKGAYTINGRPLEEFFPRLTLQRNIRQPLETVGYEEKMDVQARLHGGGVSAQAGALRHGISRALIVADPNLRGELKRRGFLTRDARAKERKKAGLKKARKRPQFSKR
jgi:small subunit ribosomal protein S9